MIIPSCIQVDKDNNENLLNLGFVKATLILKLPIR